MRNFKTSVANHKRQDVKKNNDFKESEPGTSYDTNTKTHTRMKQSQRFATCFAASLA